MKKNAGLISGVIALVFIVVVMIAVSMEVTEIGMYGSQTADAAIPPASEAATEDASTAAETAGTGTLAAEPAPVAVEQETDARVADEKMPADQPDPDASDAAAADPAAGSQPVDSPTQAADDGTPEKGQVAVEPAAATPQESGG